MCKYCDLENFEESSYDYFLENEIISNGYVMLNILYNINNKKFYLQSFGNDKRNVVQEMTFCFNCGKETETLRDKMERYKQESGYNDMTPEERDESLRKSIEGIEELNKKYNNQETIIPQQENNDEQTIQEMAIFIKENTHLYHKICKYTGCITKDGITEDCIDCIINFFKNKN